MKLNANHGLYRKHRELNKILIRKINATCEVKLTPKREFIHTSYRYEGSREPDCFACKWVLLL